MTTTAERVRRLCDALHETAQIRGHNDSWLTARSLITAAITAAENEKLEEALAKIDGLRSVFWWTRDDWNQAYIDGKQGASDAIRSLKSKDTP